MSALKKSGAPSRETTKRRRAFSPQTPKRASEFLSQPCLRETPLSQWVRRQSICKHGATVTELMPGGHVHHAAVRCADCGRHLRWIPKPETVERQKLNGYKLARLGMLDGLSDWERGFVRDVSKRRKLSPKQQEIIDRLCADYLKTAVVS